jgi:glycerol-3-phosphate dehydrogenase (NAD(P)+)
MNLSVIGAGGWGTALALLLNENRHKVILRAHERSTVDDVIESRENKTFLPGVTIPFDLKVTDSLAESVEQAKVLVLSVPVQFLQGVLDELSSFDLKNKIICNTSKGIELKTLKLPSQIITNSIPKIKKENIVTLSGPSHAEEVARGKPTNVMSASISIPSAKLVKKLFSTPNFFVDTSEDIIGVELGAALKNVIAIAAGICDGLRLGDNSKSGILIKGLNQISELGLRMGAKRETFYGLSGLGDLIVTCYSRHSRNHYVGEELGKGRSVKEITTGMKMIAEGIKTTQSAYSLVKKYKYQSGLIKGIYQVLYEHKSPHKAIIDILANK